MIAMAIVTEFINFIVPIQTIKDKYPGGWEQCLKDHEGLINHRVWFDDHLFRDGAMNPIDMEDIVEEWSSLGFDCMELRGGKRYWKDVCVFEGGPTLPCEWLSVDRTSRAAYLTGTEVGRIVGRN